MIKKPPGGAARWFVAIVLVSGATGCSMVGRPSGGMLSGLAAGRQDQKIAEHAAGSNFPSPQDVGLASAEDAQLK